MPSGLSDPKDYPVVSRGQGQAPRSRRAGWTVVAPKCWGYSLRMRPIRAIVGSSLLGLGAALLVTRRKLEAERQAHQETVLALETIKQSGDASRTILGVSRLF